METKKLKNRGVQILSKTHSEDSKVIMFNKAK